LQNPHAYEVLNPEDFGLVRHVDVGSRLTGRYAVGHHAASLGLQLSNDEINQLTRALRERAESGALNQDEVNNFIHQWYQEQQKGHLVWER
jgi:homocitrate synthase